MSHLFRNVRLVEDSVDVRVCDGVLETVAPPGTLEASDADTVVDGGWLTPPLAEPHCHLDAALLADRAPNHSGTLVEGIANWAAIAPTLTVEDVTERARTTARMYARNGCLFIRSHVDTECPVAVEALVALKSELADEGITLQLVAFPQRGILRAPGRREAWESAVRAGCDAVGAIPHFERTHDEGNTSLKLAFDLAERLDKLVDVHCDETDDPGSRHLERMCAETIDRAMAARVVAGHCTAMHSYPNPHAAKVAALVAEAGLLVVTNPLDNSVLQGRYDNGPVRRGHTRIKALWAAGCEVGIGHDSVQDPWYPLGTANLLDAAYVLVHYAQCSGRIEMDRLFRTLWQANHIPFGGAPTLERGDAATMCWWPSSRSIDILRERPTPVVYIRGREIG